MKQRSIDAQLRGRKKRRRHNIQRSKGCGNKKRYRDHGEAISALHAARAGSDKGTIPIRCYPCDRCGGFHLTSQAKRG